jgi:hypothetical protein
LMPDLTIISVGAGACSLSVIVCVPDPDQKLTNRIATIIRITTTAMTMILRMTFSH